MAATQSLMSWEAATGGYPYAVVGSFPQPDTRNWNPILKFKRGQLQFYEAVMPRHYSGGPLILTLMWTATAPAVSGIVAWQVALERHDPSSDLDTAVGQGAGQALAACSVTNGAPVYTDIGPLVALPAGFAAGDHFRLHVARGVPDDTMATDAELWSLELREA